MTAVLASDQPQYDRAEQLKQLRRQMAAVSGKVGPSRRGHVNTPTTVDDLLPGSEARLPVPPLLADVLPDALPRGTVAVLSGARSLPLGMGAAVTAAGGNAAIVGQPDVGLLAAVEMGADLSRLAVIPDPGTDPVEVAAVLMDGMDLIVLALGGRTGPLTRAPAAGHPAGPRRRLAGCGDTTGSSSLRLRNYFGQAGFRTDQRGAARGVWRRAGDQAGSGGVSGFPGIGGLVDGLGRGWPWR